MSTYFEELDCDLQEKLPNLDVTLMVLHRVYLGRANSLQRYLEIGLSDGVLVELSLSTIDALFQKQSVSLLADGANPSKIIQSIVSTYENLIP